MQWNFALRAITEQVDGCLSNSWVSRTAGNIAHVDTPLHADVSGFAPGRSPRVADNPVVHSGGSIVSVTDGDDGVIDGVTIMRAVGIIENSMTVSTEAVCGFNVD